MPKADPCISQREAPAEEMQFRTGPKPDLGGPAECV